MKRRLVLIGAIALTGAISLLLIGYRWASSQTDSAVAANDAEYQAVLARLRPQIPSEAFVILPAHVPPSASVCRMRAVVDSKACAGVTLYCKLTPVEAKEFGDQHRPHAIFRFHGYSEHGELPRNTEGKPVGSAWDRSTLEHLIGVTMPTDFETMVIVDSLRGGGLGSSFRGTRAWVLVDEQTGVVIWTTLHYFTPQNTPNQRLPAAGG